MAIRDGLQQSQRDRSARATTAWERVIWRAAQYVALTLRNIMVMMARDQLWPARTPKHLRQLTLQQEMCPHPLSYVRPGGNGDASYTSCTRCGLRLSYTAKVGKNWIEARTPSKLLLREDERRAAQAAKRMEQPLKPSWTSTAESSNSRTSATLVETSSQAETTQIRHQTVDTPPPTSVLERFSQLLQPLVDSSAFTNIAVGNLAEMAQRTLASQEVVASSIQELTRALQGLQLGTSLRAPSTALGSASAIQAKQVGRA